MTTSRRWLVRGVGVELAAALLLLWSGPSVVGSLLRSAVACLVALATIAALRAPQPGSWALWAVPAGLLGVIAGAGVGPRHLAAGDIGAGLAGIVLAVSGLLVAVGATVAWARSVSRWTRLWAVPVTLVVLVLAVPSVVAVAASDVPPTRLSGRSPAELGIVAVPISFAARDGTTLEGWWAPTTNGAAVALLHGSGSNRESVLEQMAVLVEGGYGVLAFDARGHGTSAGTGMDLGWSGEDDLAGALDLMASMPGVDPHRLGAVGLSMGGEEAVGAVGHPRLAAVVAEGATGRVAADGGWKPEHLGGLVQRGMDRWQDLVVRALSGLDVPSSLRSRVRTSSTPVLLIAAGGRPDEASAARWIQEAAPTTVEVWVAEGASHASGLEADPQEWSSHVVGFLDRTLGPVPS